MMTKLSKIAFATALGAITATSAQADGHAQK